MKRTAYLSIDFEDIAHDFKREHGIALNGPLREAALWRAYETIERFLKADLDAVRLTFFTTGIVAEKCPAIVARIAADGHEVGCHYHFHDAARGDPAGAFEENLRRAIGSLEAASGQKVLGFRAPRFSLCPVDVGHFRVLERHFAYDSSLGTTTAIELAGLRHALGLSRLALFPVPRTKVRAALPAVRSGGSYLKLFPAKVTLAAMDRAAGGGLVPMVYLHPYEFVTDRSFAVAMAEMGGMPRARRVYWALRQAQWHSIGNRDVTDKLRRIARDWRFGGPMRTLLPAAETSRGLSGA